jgi:hypothetical protein
LEIAFEVLGLPRSAKGQAFGGRDEFVLAEVAGVRLGFTGDLLFPAVERVVNPVAAAGRSSLSSR